MIAVEDVRELLDDVFEEEALAIGGLVAVRPLDDEFVHRLFESLTVIRSKALRRIDGPGAVWNRQGRDVRGLGQPHPAIEQFLSQLSRT